MPGQKIMGKNAAMVVAALAMTGHITSLLPTIEAISRLLPSWRWRKMFSTITMALSTSIPTARTREKSTIILSVNPNNRSIKNVIIMERGIADATIKALRIPIENKTTSKTRIRPDRILFSRSETIMTMSSD